MPDIPIYTDCTLLAIDSTVVDDDETCEVLYRNANGDYFLWVSDCDGDEEINDLSDAEAREWVRYCAPGKFLSIFGDTRGYWGERGVHTPWKWGLLDYVARTALSMRQ